jgi:hypothetical protein
MGQRPIVPDVASQKPLSASLSQLLVAHTIEADDLFEQRMPHSATVKHGVGLKGGGPWLVSYVMWANFLRHIDPAGATVATLAIRACVSERTLKSRLNHLSWWGYITVGQPVGETGRKPKFADHVVMLTSGGQQACAVFEPIPDEVEERWTDRFGSSAIARLRQTLEPFVADAHPDLPRFLPVVDYGDGMRTEVDLPEEATSGGGEKNLITLLGQTLLVLTLQFERASSVSLPLLANVLRVLEAEPTPIREVPRRAQVSKEAISAATTHLSKAGLADTTGTGAKMTVRLTPEGAAARTASYRTLAGVERNWGRRPSCDVASLRGQMETFLSRRTGDRSVLGEGLRPHSGGWRNYKQYLDQTEAIVSEPESALPHHPMVLHRGGFPDGA